MEGGDKEYVRQDETVKTVLGMTEDDFRDRYGWSSTIRGVLDEQPSPPRFPGDTPDIFSGRFVSLSLEDLKDEVKDEVWKQSLLRKKKSRKRSRFFILFHDPKDEKKTDVRGLMSNPKFNGATFQFASTMFGPLEGGKFYRDSKLETMYNMAVQGEFASISTIGAALYRKYILPSKVLKDLKNDKRWTKWDDRTKEWAFNNRMYALENFTWFAPKKGDRKLGNRLPYISKSGTYGRSFHIDPDKAANYKHEQGDRDRVKIPIHQNVKVQFGNVLGKDSRSRYNNRAGDLVERIKIQGDRDQRVTCVLSSTIDLRTGRKTKSGKELQKLEKVKYLQRVLQEAAYYGAVYGAAYAGSDKVVLTMVGGGSFRNDPRIIYRAIKKVINDEQIQALGIDIYLNYRHDSRRKDKIERENLASLFPLVNFVEKPLYFTDNYIDAIVDGGSVRDIVRNLHQAQGIGPDMVGQEDPEYVEPEEVVPFRRPLAKKKPFERKRMTDSERKRLKRLEKLLDQPLVDWKPKEIRLTSYMFSEPESQKNAATTLEDELEDIVRHGLRSTLLPDQARRQIIYFIMNKLEEKKEELHLRYGGTFTDMPLIEYIHFLTVLAAMCKSFIEKYHVLQKDFFDYIWDNAEEYLVEISKDSSGKIKEIPFNLKSWLE